MVIPSQRSGMAFTCSLLFLGLILTACVPAVRAPLQGTDQDLPVWPEIPAAPRVAFVKSFSTPEDLGIGKSFTQRLGEFFTGPRIERLVRPMAITVTPEGTVYVADPGIMGVHSFDIKGASYHLIRRKKGKMLPSPVALAVGPAGEVYVSDSVLSTLFVIEPGAEEAVAVPLQTLLAQPTGIASDPSSGRIYVVDTGSHSVKVFARDGAFLTSFGHRGKGDGEFNYPTMIWLDAATGQILVTDSMNFRVQVFDTAGRFLRRFGSAGDSTGYHAQPKGIASDRYGHIYVVDSLFHTIQLFDQYGTFLLNIGRQGKDWGEFFLPTGIFIDEQNTIYIADSYNQRVQVFRYVGPTP